MECHLICVVHLCPSSLQTEVPGRYILLPQVSLLDNISATSPLQPCPDVFQAQHISWTWTCRGTASRGKPSLASKTTLGYHTFLGGDVGPDSAQHHSLAWHPALAAIFQGRGRATGPDLNPWICLETRSLCACGYFPFLKSCSVWPGRKWAKVLTVVKNLMILLQAGWCKSNNWAQAPSVWVIYILPH